MAIHPRTARCAWFHLRMVSVAFSASMDSFAEVATYSSAAVAIAVEFWAQTGLWSLQSRDWHCLLWGEVSVMVPYRCVCSDVHSSGTICTWRKSAEGSLRFLARGTVGRSRL